MADFLYIHIPFCVKKCKYCSFISVENIGLIDAYVNALITEIQSKYQNERLKTIYFGGGTPSVLSTENLAKILKKFNFDEDTEITLEVNPSDITEKYLNEIKAIGINRLSVGIQSFDNNLLKIIGRRHTAEEAITVLSLIRHTGFDNVSLDLIYGLPEQTLDNYKKTLQIAVDTNVEHISLYGLKIDKGCYFSFNKPKNLPDDEMQAQMYLQSKEFLENNNYTHYEISNFAKKGYESRHNLSYWNCLEYYGFGCAAHGFVNGIRYENQNVVTDYIKSPLIIKNKYKLNRQQMLEETIFLGFRKSTGIDIKQINQKFKIDFDEKYKKIIKKYTSFGHIEKTKNGYKLTKNGILLSNYFLSEFIE